MMDAAGDPRGSPSGMTARASDRYKPAVPKVALLFVAGAAWAGVGAMLLAVALRWFSAVSGMHCYGLAGAGVVAGLLVHHLGFLRIVDRNLERILPMEGNRCVFSFVPWRSYLLASVMVAAGVMLRHSAIPKDYLAVLYTGIGLGLVLSSVRYLRVFLRERRR
jgi:hypothetical protein